MTPPPPPAPAGGPEPVPGSISIRDLRIHCIVGVYSHERTESQDLFFDLDLDLDLAEAARTDHIGSTLDYTRIARLLEETALSGKFRLIESLAVKACDALLAHYPEVSRCRLAVKKPRALDKASHAAIEVERRRPVLPAAQAAEAQKPLRAPAAAAPAPLSAPTALVTGSAKRLGRELALRLGTLGYFVFVHYKESKAEAEETLRLLRAAGGAGEILQADIGIAEERVRLIREAVAGRGRLDLLVNNVGLYRTGPLLDYAVSDFDLTLQTNLVGPFELIRMALPSMAEGASIVNIGYSGIETLSAAVHNTAYLISKTGLFILTKSLAAALGPRSIRVNMISPGILANSVELPRHPPDFIPLGSLGECRDIADALEFLIGEKARYVTGVNLDVAGGYMLELKTLPAEPGKPERS